jgi:hypothetical protein
MRECGVFRRLLLQASTEMSETEVPFITVDFKTVEPIILLLALGVVVASVLLLFEIILRKMSLPSVKGHVKKNFDGVEVGIQA